jgi:branched-chain amino acid transport system permease protein
VPPFAIAGDVAIAGDRFTRIPNYAIACAIVILCLLALVNLLHSRAGRALRALHGSEEAAASMGVDVAKYKLGAFVLAAVFAAAAGSFLTHYNGSIGPGEASVMKSVRYVAIVAVGGMSNLWATLGTGIALTFLSLRGLFGVYDDAVFGAILVLVMLFAPEGFVRSRLRGEKARRTEAAEGTKP